MCQLSWFPCPSVSSSTPSDPSFSCSTLVVAFSPLLCESIYPPLTLPLHPSNPRFLVIVFPDIPTYQRLWHPPELLAALHRYWVCSLLQSARDATGSPQVASFIFRCLDLTLGVRFPEFALRPELSFSWCTSDPVLGGQHRERSGFPPFISFSSFLPLLTSSCGLVPSIL